MHKESVADASLKKFGLRIPGGINDVEFSVDGEGLEFTSTGATLSNDASGHGERNNAVAVMD